MIILILYLLAKIKPRKSLSASGWRLGESAINSSLPQRYGKRYTVIRRRLIFLSQYSTNYKQGDHSLTQKVNFVGNSSKSLHLSIHDSLQKLRTDYIDILYVHWWDYETSVEEVMNALHNLVVQGKVLYLVGVRNVSEESSASL